METKKTCTTCFYKPFSRKEFPCTQCTNYGNYVSDTAFEEPKDVWPFPKTYKNYPEPTVPLEEALKPHKDKYLPLETQVGGGPKYDVVESPKHYMLFEDKGIEVRHVIERLIQKADQADIPEVPPGAMFFADYAQMLQYVMRFMEKNGLEDLKKAQWYLTKMVEAYEPSDA